MSYLCYIYVQSRELRLLLLKCGKMLFEGLPGELCVEATAEAQLVEAVER